LQGRLEGAAGGAAAGGLLGGAVPVVSAVGRSLVAPIAARLYPDRYAKAALATALNRSGVSADTVSGALTDAASDGQGSVYTVADALGHTGQRLLSTVTRNPNDARQAVVEALQSRQAGQGRRITNALSEGFAAPDTAAQRIDTLTAARDTAADANYAAARQNAGPVDVSGAIGKIDQVLQPGATGVMNPGSQLAPDSVEAALMRAKSLLGNGNEQIVDFSSALRTKMDLDDMISRAVRTGSNNQARLLIGARDELDNALANASDPYAAARDAYRAGSQNIEAVGTGRTAATRGRTEDTTATFAQMTPDQQSAFRAGYADPLIAQTQGAAVGVNKARSLLSDATAAEFPAFAAPGQADQLMTRLNRENQMFETNQAALGGSKTQDNLSDTADMASIDRSILSHLARGRVVPAIAATAGKLASNAQGLPPPVLVRIARTLMETRPDVAKAVLSEASRGQSTPGARAVANAILTNLAATGSGKLASAAIGLPAP
jgi:hypothetical protein